MHVIQFWLGDPATMPQAHKDCTEQMKTECARKGYTYSMLPLVLADLPDDVPEIARPALLKDLTLLGMSTRDDFSDAVFIDTDCIVDPQETVSDKPAFAVNHEFHGVLDVFICAVNGRTEFFRNLYREYISRGIDRPDKGGPVYGFWNKILRDKAGQVHEITNYLHYATTARKVWGCGAFKQ